MNAMNGHSAEMTPAAAYAEPVVLRPMRADERETITKQWLRSYAHSPFGEQFAEGLFEARWQPVVASLMERGEVTILAPADSPDAMIYGWRCVERRPDAIVLHYLHVRGSSRRLGYGMKLLEGLGLRLLASHATGTAQRICKTWRDQKRADRPLVLFDLTAV